MPFPAFKYHHMAYDRAQHALGNPMRTFDLMRSYIHQ
jgi:hypothetical protein